MGEEKEGLEDVEELRMLLKVVKDFIRDLKDPLKDLFRVVAEMADGERLGREVAAFYRELASSMPEDVAREMTREFFQWRLRSIPSIGELISSPSILRRAEGSLHGVAGVGHEKGRE